MRFIYLLLYLLPCSLFAQLKGWQELTISEGLSQGMIFDLEQDQKGFIWVATKDGLNRYDGHNFTVFTHDPYNNFSLSDNYCSTLLLDSRGRLWVGTLNQGLNLFDDQTQRFYHVDINDRGTAGGGNYEIRLLTEDPEGNIWVSTDTDQLFKISLPVTLRQRFPEQPNFTGQVRFNRLKVPEAGASGFSYRPDGEAWAGTDHGLFTFNWRQPGGVTKLVLPDQKNLEFYSTYSDARQDFRTATTGNTILCRFKGRWKTISLPQTDRNINIKAVDSTTLAIATMNRLWLMSSAELFAQDSLTARNAFTTMPANVYETTNLLKDQTGNLWVGTSGYGLRKFNPRIRQFHSYLPNTTIFYLFADRQGRLYTRHELAYQRVDLTTNQLVPFLSNSLPAPDRRQRYLMQDSRGIFWASNVNFETHVQHLFKFSADWQLLKKYPLPPGTSFGFYGNRTIEDNTGCLWIGANTGKLLRFNPATEAFQVFSYESILRPGGAEIETYALHQDRAGTLWIGTQKGLVRADNLLTAPRFSIYRNTTNRQSLSNDFVSCIVDDPYQPARYLWVGTKGGGLERLDKLSGQFSHFTEAQGLHNKVVYGILTDEFNNLWLSTNRGLARFNPKTRAFQTYTKADGLQGDEFNTGSHVKLATGELLFGGVNGLTLFRAGDVIRKASQRPLANIIGLKVNNEAVAVGGSDGILSVGIEHTGRINLSHTQNLLTLEFGLMDYTNSAKNRYRYRLKGIDRDWVEAGTNRFANYAQLPDGHYLFQMMGSPDGETWSAPVDLHVRVNPPFYATWWAYLLYVVAIIALGWQLYRFQTQRLLLKQQVSFEKKEVGRLAELDKLKTQFFTNISHEFRTPLTLILGPLTDLKHRLQTEKAVSLTEPIVTLMEQNSNRLLSLINQLLDLSKLEAGQLKPELQPGELATLFRTLASSFNSLAQSRRIQFTFSQPVSEYQASIDRDKIEKIVTNLLSNAFKFTPQGQKVHMAVEYPPVDLPGELILTVEDTGIGIAPANLTTIFERFYQVDSKASRQYEGTGIGLSLVNELVKVLGGSIAVTSTEGIGTRFTVRLPLLPIENLPAATSGEAAERTQALQPARNGRPPALIINAANSADAGAAAVALPISGTDNFLLIIDDNADIRAYVRSVFESDYRIIEAEDGQDGLEKATATLPNIIICDLMMPRLDGFGFCQLLKSQEATSHIPVVMLTAKATVEDRIEGFTIGADDYLTKPFHQSELRARVRNLLVKQLRLQQYYSGRETDMAPASQVRSEKEENFLRKTHTIVDRHLSDSRFDVDEFSQQMSMSQSQLVRKLKALTGQTAVEYVRNYRLEVAAERLRQGKGSVSEIAYEVGFESLSYFTRVFQDKFAVLPSATIPNSLANSHKTTSALPDPSAINTDC